MANAVGKVFLGTQHEHIGLDSCGLQLFHRVLCGLGLQLISGLEVRYISEMHAEGTVAEFPFHLTDGLKEGCRLDVADGAADFLNHEVDLVFILHDTAFDLVGDMRHHLDGLAEVVAMAFLVDDGLIDLARRHRIGLGCTDAREALVVAKVEVGLRAVNSHVALAVLVGIQRPRVDIDIRVDFLYGDGVATGLQQFADAGRNNAFTQGGNHASCHKNIACHSDGKF